MKYNCEIKLEELDVELGTVAAFCSASCVSVTAASSSVSRAVAIDLSAVVREIESNLQLTDVIVSTLLPRD